MTDANKLSEVEIQRVDAVDKPATTLKFLIRKAAATGPEIQVGTALPDNKIEGSKDAEDAELVDGSDLVQKIAKAVAGELAPSLDKIATALEAANIVKVAKAAAKPESKQAQGDDSTQTKTAVKKRGEGIFTSVVFGQK